MRSSPLETVMLSEIAQKLKRDLELGKYDNGQPLPTVRHLRLEYRVGSQKVSQAYQELLKIGLIEKPSNSKQFYKKGALLGLMKKSSPAKKRHEIICETIQSEIILGIYDHQHPFPTLKSLCQKHQCSYKTINQALNALVKASQLEFKGGGRYALPRKKIQSHHSSSIYIINNRWIIDSAPWKPITLIDALEKEMELAHWNPLRLFLSESPKRAKLPNKSQVNGIVHFYSPSEKIWIKKLQSFESLLIVIIDMGQHQLSLPFKRMENILIIQPDNYSAGLELGKHMINRGHHSIAYIKTTDNDEIWSREREKGVIAARQTLPSIHFKAVKLDFSKAIKDEKIIKLKSSIGKIRKTLQNSKIFPRVTLPFFTRQLYNYLPFFRLYPQVKRTFDQLLMDSDCTAWIFENDILALLAKQYLHSKKRNIPRDISISGFDNSIIGCQANLTSYDFNLERMAKVAFDFFSGQKHKTSSENVIQVKGRIVSRSTT